MLIHPPLWCHPGQLPYLPLISVKIWKVWGLLILLQYAWRKLCVSNNFELVLQTRNWFWVKWFQTSISAGIMSVFNITTDNIGRWWVSPHIKCMQTYKVSSFYMQSVLIISSPTCSHSCCSFVSAWQSHRDINTTSLELLNGPVSKYSHQLFFMPLLSLHPLPCFNNNSEL